MGPGCRPGQANTENIHVYQYLTFRKESIIVRRTEWIMTRLVALALATLSIALPARAGIVRGTVPTFPAHHEPDTGDGWFWRLAPAEPASSASAVPAVIVLESPGSAKDGESGEQDQTGDITLEGYGIQPSLQVVSTESTLRIRNRDPRSYSCFAEGQNAFQFSNLGRGEQHEATFLSAGAVHLRCHRFPFMQATVLVVDSPWYTQAASGESFSIRKVPEGQYTLKVFANGAWHATRDIQVTAGGTVEVNLGGPSPAGPSATRPSGKQPPPVERRPPPVRKRPEEKQPPREKQPPTAKKPPGKTPAEKQPPRKQPSRKRPPGKKPPRAGEQEPAKEPDEAVEPAFKDVEPEIEIEEE